MEQKSPKKLVSTHRVKVYLPKNTNLLDACLPTPKFFFKKYFKNI